MSKTCPKCGQAIADDLKQCPYCGSEVGEEQQNQNSVQDIVEVPSQNDTLKEEVTPNKTDVEQKNEEVPVQQQPSVEEVVDVPTAEKEPKTVASIPASDSSVVNFNSTESSEKSEANETSDTTITNDNVLQEVSVNDLETVSVDSSNLETVSIEASQEELKQPEEVIQMPEIPAPTIGEVDPNMLSTKYDEEEKINNEKIEQKKKHDEEEYLKREAEMKNKPIEKPDLLAPGTINTGSSNEITQKKNKKKNGKILIIILIILIVLVAVWYFFIRETKNQEKGTYMTPVVTWFKGYNDGNVTTMLSSYIPCLASSDEIINTVNDTINNRLTYKSFYLEYKESKVEVVNSADQTALDDYLNKICTTNAPKVDEYKRVYINEKVSNTDDNKVEETNPQFYTARIDNKWYVLAFQEQ